MISGSEEAPQLIFPVYTYIQSSNRDNPGLHLVTFFQVIQQFRKGADETNHAWEYDICLFVGENVIWPLIPSLKHNTPFLGLIITISS